MTNEAVDIYNPTCCVTGKKDNLRMYPIRNYLNNMIGWIFLHESVNREEWNLNFNYCLKNEPNLEPFTVKNNETNDE